MSPSWVNPCSTWPACRWKQTCCSTPSWPPRCRSWDAVESIRKKFEMKLLKNTLALLCALFVAIAAHAIEPIKIGLVSPMSGPFAGYGKQIEHGVRLYLSTHGDSVAGRKIQLIIRDDSPGTAGDVSKRMATELVVNDRVDILAGFAFTPAAF